MSDEFDKEEEFVGGGGGIIELDVDDLVDPEVEVPDIESEFDSGEEEDPDDLGLDIGDPMD